MTPSTISRTEKVVEGDKMWAEARAARDRKLMTIELTVAVDGSCHLNIMEGEKSPTGWAWFAEDGRFAYAGVVDGTNNVGELLAILNVLIEFPDTPLVIQADSAYAIGCASTWAEGWSRKGWVNSKKETVANLEIVQSIFALMQARKRDGVPVRFQKVKAHLADTTIWPLNAAVDELAGLASERAKLGLVDVVRNDSVEPQPPAEVAGVELSHAVLAGAQAILDTGSATSRSVGVTGFHTGLARAVLDAATPFILSAERERLIELVQSMSSRKELILALGGTPD
ncbi:MAG: RNase H family protein [Aeromicrobium sp.]